MLEYIKLQPAVVSLEELTELVTEITNEPLVEVDDVASDLNKQINDITDIRSDVAANGLDRATAVVVGAAVEGFLDRHDIQLMSPHRSVDGVRWALEELDEGRQSRIQKLWAWLLDRLKAITQMVTNLFGANGRGNKARDAAKAAAEAASDRKPKKVSDMIKDPTAADQEARIEPQGEKSGKYEDFVERHKQYCEPLRADFNRINESIGENPVLSTMCNNPEAVTAFFTQMEGVSDKVMGVRGILDKASQIVRSSKEAQTTAQELAKCRTDLYKLFGGDSPQVLESIGQKQFTAQEYKPLEYDELVPIMVKVTNNIPAANSQQRINELGYLTKAVGDFTNISSTNVFKNMDATHRNVVLQAMQALANDITTIATTLNKDWSLVLQIHGAASMFWQKELAFYYKVIAAIQKAATETFEEADRTALYENFKRMGFSVDLTPEELKRRGAGLESHVDPVPSKVQEPASAKPQDFGGSLYNWSLIGSLQG